MLNHLAIAPERGAIFRAHLGSNRAAVLRPEHREEFEADQFAISFLFQGEGCGGLRPGFDRNLFWLSRHAMLGWLFSVMGAIEIIANRIGFPITDTHPPAAERWSRIGTLICDREPIHPQVINLDRIMRANALRSAETGALPEIRKEMLKEIKNRVTIPGHLLHPVRKLEDQRNDRVPSGEVFSAWINSPTVDEAKDILKRHAELLHPKVDSLHYALAKEQPQEVARQHILLKRLLLLQRCREIGIDAAFEELARGDSQCCHLSQFQLLNFRWIHFSA
jgi:hypothetical protein